MNTPKRRIHAGIAQLVERNLAKVEVESSRLFSRSRFLIGKPRLPFFVDANARALIDRSSRHWRDSKAVMHRIANPSSPVRLRVAPPVSMRVASVFALLSLLQFR